MNSPYFSGSESLLLSAGHVYVDDIRVDILLTNRRIILVDSMGSQLKTREIPLVIALSVQPTMTDLNEPALTLTVVTASGSEAVRPITVIFSHVEHEHREWERDQWLEALVEVLPEARDHARGSSSPPRPAGAKRSHHAISGRRIEKVRPQMTMAVHPPAPPRPSVTHAIVLDAGDITGRLSEGCPDLAAIREPPAGQDKKPSVSPLSRPEISGHPVPEERPVAVPGPDHAIPNIPVPETRLFNLGIRGRHVRPWSAGQPDTDVHPALHTPGATTDEDIQRESAPADIISGQPVTKEYIQVAPVTSEIATTVLPAPAMSGDRKTGSAPDLKSGTFFPIARRHTVTVAIIVLGVFLLGVLVLPFIKIPPTGPLVQQTPAPAMPSGTGTPGTSIPAQARIAIPENGVWILIEYTGAYTGWLGNAGRIQPVSGTGANLYKINNADRIVEVSLQKQDNSGDWMTVDIFRDGTLIQHSSTGIPMGTVHILIDPVTARPPGML